MLLQWICHENEIDGIRYFSTHTPRGAYKFFNYAFPAAVIEHRGRCSYLRDKFRITDPIAWPLLQELRFENIDFGASNAGTDIAVAKGMLVNYNATGFYISEMSIKALEKAFPEFSKQVAP